MSESDCSPCQRGECELCDTTAWRGSAPTYCRCWAYGHGAPRGEVIPPPRRWVGAERDPDPAVSDESARMDAYEGGRHA